MGLDGLRQKTVPTGSGDTGRQHGSHDTHPHDATHQVTFLLQLGGRPGIVSPRTLREGMITQDDQVMTDDLRPVKPNPDRK